MTSIGCTTDVSATPHTIHVTLPDAAVRAPKGLETKLYRYRNRGLASLDASPSRWRSIRTPPPAPPHRLVSRIAPTRNIDEHPCKTHLHAVSSATSQERRQGWPDMIVLECVLFGGYRVHDLDGIARRRDSHIVSRASIYTLLSITTLCAGQRGTQLKVKTNDALLFPRLLDSVQALPIGLKL